MTTTTLAPPTSADEKLAELLEQRGNPMAAAREADWLKRFRRKPKDAAYPLAMSGVHPRAVGSYGAEFRQWMKAEHGVTLRWWQDLAATRQLEHDADGRLVFREIVETGPRRIGKSTRLRGVALWRCDLGAERIGEQQLAMLVSKDLAVGKEIHRGAWRWADRKGWNVLKLGGAQEVESRHGDRWLLRAPGAAYGYDVGYGQVDEAWGVDPEAITDGIEPALLERIWAQLHLTSTAHAKASSLMRRRLVAALRDADPDVLLLFWGAHPLADFSLESTWRAASPHWSTDRLELVRRKYAAALAGEAEPEFDDPDPVRGWAAQYLNVWPGLLAGGGRRSVMPKWADRASTTKPPKPAALGISADLDGVWLSLAASSSRGELAHVGAVLRCRATEQRDFIAEVRRIQRKREVDVAIDKKGPAAFLLPYLKKADVQVTTVGLDDLTQGCADLEQGIENGAVEHGDHPELNDAVEAAGWRRVGNRRVFAADAGDISMLEAAALALATAEHSTTDEAWGYYS